MPSFERFTDNARRVLTFGNREAQDWGHEALGIDFAFVGLLLLANTAVDSRSVAIAMVKKLGYDPDAVRDLAVGLLQKGTSTLPPGRLPNTPTVDALIEQACRVARRLDHSHVGSEHLLVAFAELAEGQWPEEVRRVADTPDLDRLKTLLGQGMLELHSARLLVELS